MSSEGTGTPHAEFEVDDALVRRLLRAQHPDLAELPVQPIESGWDNHMFRLGDRLAVRLPRRETAVELAIKEREWLPRLAPKLTVMVPAPLRRGEADAGYPWPWTIVPWIPGVTADEEPLAPGEAVRLAAFLRALHAVAPAEAPRNPFRGVPLGDRARGIEERLVRLARNTAAVTTTVRDVWEAALATPASDRPRWIHGDLHPRNVVARAGLLAGVIDWGDLAAGDPATDLASVWMLLEDPTARAGCLEAYGASADLRARAGGWAVFFGTALLDHGLVDEPRHAMVGTDTLRRLGEDP